MMHTLSKLFASCAAAAIASATGAGVTLTPIEQQRSTGSFIIVPPCEPEVVSDYDEAKDFGPFAGDVASIRICDFAQAEALASQLSSIEPEALLATGSTFSLATSGVITVIHAIPDSYFEVTFAIAEDARANITALLSAGGAAPVVLSYAQVRLHVDGGAIIVDRSVEPDPDGELITLKLDKTVLLPAGTYVLWASAASVIDSMVPPNGSGVAMFDVALHLFDLADLTQDGTVDGADFGVLLGAWGQCSECDECTADLDGDCTVGGSDLGVLFGAWGD